MSARVAPAFFALALAGCVAAPSGIGPDFEPAQQPHFDPMAFFTGRLVGTGKLKKAFSSTEETRVLSDGHVTDGTLVLTQEIHEGQKPARTRTWTMRQVAPGRYVGTLTDAKGPVTVETEGNRLHIAFIMKGGLPTEQWLTLSPDGQTAHNVLKVRKLGIVVAVLVEEISRSR